MVKLSDLVLAAELAPQSRLEKALDVLRGFDAPELVTVDQAARACGVSKRSIYRHCDPVEVLGGKNWYDLDKVREALRG